MTTLPEPDFIQRDPTIIESEAIALYEQITDKTLYPAQPERLLINLLAYRETLTRIGIQEAAKQNLVNYATGANLEQLGELLGVTRLAPQFARVTLRFTKDPGAIASSVLVPAGSRAQTGDSAAIFETVENLTIPGTAESGTVIAQATIAGEFYNGFAPGQINSLVDPIANIASVTNTTTSNSGADAETDERFRTRIKLAPNVFSVAGSTGAYLYWTLTADSTITTASIASPFPTRVEVYPLTNAGLPSTEVINAVADVLTADKIRPLTDEVVVAAPTQVGYAIAANITLLATSDSASLSGLLQEAAEAFAEDRRSGLGRDVVRSQLIAALSLPGVYSVAIASPSNDVIVAPSQWANCTSISVSIVGTNEG